jgi:micrococcal nuclease
MKTQIKLSTSVIFFILYTTTAFAQKPAIEITIAEAKDHVGDKVTICAEIMETYSNTKAKGEPTMLNFGAPYPKQSFSCIIWKDDLVNFKYNPAAYLKGKQVCITGIIKMYKGKPEMEVHGQDQIFE